MNFWPYVLSYRNMRNFGKFHQLNVLKDISKENGNLWCKWLLLTPWWFRWLSLLISDFNLMFNSYNNTKCLINVFVLNITHISWCVHTLWLLPFCRFSGHSPVIRYSLITCIHCYLYLLFTVWCGEGSWGDVISICFFCVLHWSSHRSSSSFVLLLVVLSYYLSS